MTALPRARLQQLAAALIMTAVLALALLWGIDLQQTHPALVVLVTVLFTLNAAGLAGSSVTAITGMATPAPSPAKATVSPGRCALLWTICGEDPTPLAARLRQTLRALDATGQAHDCTIFVLSDTTDPKALRAERAALAPLLSLGLRYRNRVAPTGRKPGNLRDWFTQHGASFETMLMLDADSGFSAERLADLRAQMATAPQLGLVQAAIRLRPGASRFARLQRLSGRLCGPVFARGLSRLSGDTGNFWGHNALIRTRAFAEITKLPDLPGRAPWGGPMLSHDFVEAAFLRRSGWTVQIDPDNRGSFEDAPETVGAHFRRDRRWAQGNLQHLRVIGAKGLHPASRLHLAAGIQSYLSAPIWLALVLLFGSGAVHATAAALLPLAAMLGLLMVPKLAGLLDIYRKLRTRRRRAIVWRALWAELALSTLFAPLAMLRRTGFVGSVALGRDSGWLPSGVVQGQAYGTGRIPVLAGLAITGAVMAPQALIGETMTAALLAGLLVMPVTLPLLCAPWLVPWLDQRPEVTSARRHDDIKRYYDASTGRFLRVGGSGAALAIHRPLWGPGVTSTVGAAAHINALVAEAAEQALGQAPAQVRDLGCGVGGTLLHLARQWPEARLGGLTLSAAQVQIAQQHLDARHLRGRVSILHSDFALPTTLPPADLALAIESHVHCDSAASFLRAVQLHLRPGGVLIIADDMLSDDLAASTAPDAARLIDAFQRGWHLGHVSPASSLIADAKAQGFRVISVTDLTPLLRLDRLRDRALRVIGPVADALGLARVPLFANIIGGNALTNAYRAGFMRYQLMVLQLAEDQSQPAAPLARQSAA